MTTGRLRKQLFIPVNFSFVAYINLVLLHNSFAFKQCQDSWPLHLILHSWFSYLLMENIYDNLFLLFSKGSCLQPLSSNLCNSSNKSSINCILPLVALLPNIHAAIHHVITHDHPFMFTAPYCGSIFFYLLEPYPVFPHLSSYPPNLIIFSILLQIHISKPSVYFYLPVLMSRSLQHTVPHSKPDTL